MNTNILRVYYAATALFVSLDFGFDINVRAAFLESAPGLRLAFYVILFGCLALTIWRPSWTTLIGTVESLVTLGALIINMAISVRLSVCLQPRLMIFWKLMDPSVKFWSRPLIHSL